MEILGADTTTYELPTADGVVISTNFLASVNDSLFFTPHSHARDTRLIYSDNKTINQPIDTSHRPKEQLVQKDIHNIACSWQ